MPPNSIPPQDHDQRFVAEAKQRGEVYGLQDRDGGWAVCDSVEDENIDVILFWSDRAFAAQHKKEDWQEYAVTPVPLDEFVEAWLKGMHEDGSVVGPNWDTTLSGPEVEPIDLARKLTEDKPPTLRRSSAGSDPKSRGRT